MRLSNNFTNKLLATIPFLIILSFSSTNEIDIKKKRITNIKNTFKYGSYEQQAETLQQFLNPSISPQKNQALFDALEILLIQQEDDGVSLQLLKVIKERKLSQYYKYLPDFLETASAKKDPLPQASVHLICNTLELIQSISNLSQAGIFTTYFDDESKHHNNARIKTAAIKGLGYTKPIDMRTNIINFYKQSDNESIKKAIIETISAYKVEKDITFLEKIIFDEGENSIHRWLALVALKEYAPSTKGLRIVKECYDLEDIDFKSRALYVLSYYSSDEMLSEIKKASRSSSYKLRLQAVKALQSYNTDDVNELLQFKYKYDSLEIIKQAAKKILLERGIIKEEKKDDKKKDKK